MLHILQYIDGSVQDCRISGALAMEILQSCTKPSISSYGQLLFNKDTIEFCVVFLVSAVFLMVHWKYGSSYLEEKHVSELFQRMIGVLCRGQCHCNTANLLQKLTIDTVWVIFYIIHHIACCTEYRIIPDLDITALACDVLYQWIHAKETWHHW